MKLLLEMRGVRAQRPNDIVLSCVSHRETECQSEMPTSCSRVDGRDLAQRACNGDCADDRDETVDVRLHSVNERLN